jgi:hypothetical protein
MNFESPEILSDLYRDLRDRHLLPVIAVLLALMVLVVVGLSKSPQHPPVAPAASTGLIKPSSSSVPATQVVLSQPGLRDYKKRLKGDKPVDPFTILPGFGGSASAGSSGTTPGSNSPLSDGVTPSNSAPLTPEGQEAAAGSGSSAPAATTPSTPSSGGGTSTSGEPEIKYYSYRAKVRSGQLGEELKVHDSIGSLATLPSKSVPALSFLGVNLDSGFNAKSAVFLVSSEVSAVSGEGQCSSGGSTCQLLALKPGQHADVVWSDGLTYRIDLVKFKLISRNSLPSVGNNRSKSGSGDSGTGRSSKKQAKHTGFYFSF